VLGRPGGVSPVLLPKLLNSYVGLVNSLGNLLGKPARNERGDGSDWAELIAEFRRKAAERGIARADVLMPKDRRERRRVRESAG
jgi:hypothetical protein